MKRMSFWVLSLVVLVSFGFTACGPAQPTGDPGSSVFSTSETSTSEESAGSSEKSSRLETSSSIVSEPSSTDSSSSDSSAGSRSVQSAQSIQSLRAPVGGSPSEIVSFYNQVANAVKSAPKITVKKRDKRHADMDLPAALKAMAPKNMTENSSSDETKIETFVQGTSANGTLLDDFLPIRGTHVVSQLKESYTKSAVCRSRSDSVEVLITLNDEPMTLGDTSGGKIYRSCMPMDGGRQERSDGSGGNGNSMMKQVKAEATIKNGQIIAVVGADGQLLSLSLSYQSLIVGSVMGASFKVVSEVAQEYTFS